MGKTRKKGECGFGEGPDGERVIGRWVVETISELNARWHPWPRTVNACWKG